MCVGFSVCVIFAVFAEYPPGTKFVCLRGDKALKSVFRRLILIF